MTDQDSYTHVYERLEEIVAQVRSKDVPLEKSLELYEEALRLGGIAAEMIDRTDFSLEELQAAEQDQSEELVADQSTAVDELATEELETESELADPDSQEIEAEREPS